jgi:hypothetical protein
MFKALLLASALINSAPVHATSTGEPNHTNAANNTEKSELKACWLSPECFQSLEKQTSQLEPDHAPKILKIFTLKIARR